MKEIWKKCYRANKSLRPVAAAYEPIQNHKAIPVYRADLIKSNQTYQIH